MEAPVEIDLHERQEEIESGQAMGLSCVAFMFFVSFVVDFHHEEHEGREDEALTLALSSGAKCNPRRH